MKIAILTLPLHTNYGGLLQAYALQSALERMGYEVSVLDKIRKPKVQIPFSVSVKRLIIKFILRKNVAPIGQLEDYKRRKSEIRILGNLPTSIFTDTSWTTLVQ